MKKILILLLPINYLNLSHSAPHKYKKKEISAK